MGEGRTSSTRLDMLAQATRFTPSALTAYRHHSKHTIKADPARGLTASEERGSRMTRRESNSSGAAIGAYADATPCDSISAPLAPSGGPIIYLTSSNGGLLSLRCEGRVGAVPLLQQSVHVAHHFLQIEDHNQYLVYENEEGTDLEMAMGMRGWADEVLLRGTVTVGPYEGLTAIGAGNNMKTRKRVVNIALAVMAIAHSQCEGRPVPLVDHRGNPWPPLLGQLLKFALAAMKGQPIEGAADATEERSPMGRALEAPSTLRKRMSGTTR